MKVITFGCRLNTFETAVMKQLAADDLDDVVVINTCAVTGEAERQCRQAVRQTARDNPDKKIVVTGCAAQLHPDIFAAMPEVTRVLGNHEKLSRAILLGDDKVCVGDLSEPPADLPIVSDFEGRSKAFLQIQQGCDNACTFCIVRHARGKNIGLPPDKVIEQARTFTTNGFSEIILTGVDVASYPHDLWGLTKRLLTEVDGLKRLRFGSLDPAGVGDDLLDLMATYPALMPAVHLSIQAGDNLILKRMGRRHTFEDVTAFTNKLYQVRPNATLGADLITGFPTETPEQFQRTLDLIEAAQITHAHVFPYSARPGTPAAKMPPVPKQERIARAELARTLSARLKTERMEQLIGQTVTVLTEQDNMGYTDTYFPVRLIHPTPPGELVSVTIQRRDDHVLVG